ncbi:peptidylprolyl isomerase [Ichthyenterobacterium magnum]|uniref:Peptidyl-prolyl cis-trans isomerase n=1 Tax=Ichthyenterobacterium magnum TaxID=1230530 RepID=A0A420DGN0_9FLAO|nr:peptidylprolyl isomerase [Ichthyenterobacterium magnum]RKE92236.1 cyclophilin family peptidyl-prolyl cis-trans isomerase [Ichthyenterobacterium magnum]
MRAFILICLCCFILNCEDKQSQKKTNTIAIDSAAIKKEQQKQEETRAESQRKYPYLTDKNAVEFFQEYEKENKENKVRITTNYGDIDILLYNKTKYHRANFVFLTKQKYFDGAQFHRVVKNFIIQGGNSDERKIANKRKQIGRYLLPNDTRQGYTHKRGVISMPSSENENPHKLASPYEFFITQSNQPHLDGDYTIFGKVIKGMNVVDKIASQETDNAEWPLHNIYIKKVEIIN